jgi:hypothetical protein
VTPELEADRAQALTVPCPFPPKGCGEPIGAPCTRESMTGDREPLENLPAHPARLDAAGVVHAPLDPRELAYDPDTQFRRW